MNMAITNHKVGVVMKRTKGFALLDVLLAIVIFAVGMLALASLQTNLTRSSVDSNSRMVAVNMGEEIIERLRSFQRVTTDPDGVIFAFADIDDDFVEAFGGNRGGLNYTVTGTVLGYNYNDEGTDVEAPVPAVAGTVYDFKRVELTIAWDVSAEFQVDEGRSVSAGDMNSGEVTIEGLVSSIPAFSSAQVAAESESLGDIPVNYTPGARPDIVQLVLGNDKFKEALKPRPELKLGATDSVETWFDVTTYNQRGELAPAVFLRREEFLAVSCECELQVSGGSGRTPTTWNGYAYTEGKLVSKNSGVAVGNQSFYCDVCCANHHDGADVFEIDDKKSLTYGPSSGSTSVDHKHWGYGRVQGQVQMVEATSNGDEYLEACRMVRVNGFMHVAQDLYQHGFYGFPESYLESDAGTDYGAFVVAAANTYFGTYKQKQPMDQPEDVGYIIPASTGIGDDRTNLPTVPTLTKPISTEDQQMHSRGVYLDYLTVEAQNNIADCFDNDDATVCINPAIDPALDSPSLMYPFFDVQLTWLGRWNVSDDFIADPVDVTNQPLASDNAHDRGRAFLLGSKLGQSEVVATSHTGNLGLTGTGKIDKDYESQTVQKTVYVTASGDETPYPTTGVEISGALSSDWNKVKPADFVIKPSQGVYCGQTDTRYTCIVTPSAIDPTIELSNYVSQGALWGCSLVLDVTAPGLTTTVFALPVVGNRRDADIWVQKVACPN